MKLFHACGHVLGGTFLIAGTTIGVGMLALPVATGPGGFFPAISIYLLTWIFMLCTGLLLMEVCLWMPKDANLITMTERLLGPIGRNLCWLIYLFLFVTVMIAHIVGGGGVLNEIIGAKMNIYVSTLIYVILFSPIVYLGTHSVDRLNLCLMTGVILTYFLFVFFSWSHVQPVLLKFVDWTKAWKGLPILFTAFTYQVIIPTLMTYMDRNVKKVRLAIILGTTIPLIVYLIWEMLILGIVPIEGPNGLIAAAKSGDNAVAPLKHYLNAPALFSIGKAFAFFTMTTSYVALSLAYLDFLADGLKIKKKGFQKVLLCLAVFVPPTFIAWCYPDVFLVALSYAGGISCALLFGLLPPLLVWIGRYRKKYSLHAAKFLGRKETLLCLFIFVFVVMGLEIYTQILHLTHQG